MIYVLILYRIGFVSYVHLAVYWYLLWLNLRAILSTRLKMDSGCCSIATVYRRVTEVGKATVDG